MRVWIMRTGVSFVVSPSDRLRLEAVVGVNQNSDFDGIPRESAATAFGIRPFEIAQTAAASTLIDRLLDEILAVVTVAGIRLPEDDPRALIHAHCQERSNQPSMLQHLRSRRRTEIDALNGALVQRGQALGIATPCNEAIVLMVKALEAAALQKTPGDPA